MSRRGFVAVVFWALVAAAVFSLGNRDGEVQGAGSGGLKDGQTVTVTGTLRRVGNEPFSRLVVTDADGLDWYLAQEDEAAVALREQRQVSVEGTLRLLPMILANGKKLPDRRELTKVRLLE